AVGSQIRLQGVHDLAIHIRVVTADGQTIGDTSLEEHLETIEAPVTNVLRLSRRIRQNDGLHEILDVVVEQCAADPRTLRTGRLPANLKIRCPLGPEVRIRRHCSETGAVELEKGREATAVRDTRVELPAIVVAVD